MMNFISSLFIGAALTIGSWFGLHQPVPAPVAEAAPTFGAFNPTGGGTYRLQSSVGLSNTTITLSAFKEPISNIPYTMTYLGSSVGYGTLDPQSSRSEFVSFTGITQNSNGTAQLTGVTRGLTRTPAGNLCTASTTLTQAHSGQSIFILSDSPCLFAEYYVLRNNATSSGILVFGSTTPPRYDAVGAQSTGTYIATTSEFASIAYVNAIAVGGSSNATESVKGISELATALEQASSTILGSTGAGTVMQARYATDTPQSGCAVGYTATAGAGCSIIASLSGKLKQTWIDLTAAFTWSGLHIFNAGFLSNASSTLSATTTIAANSVTNNALRLNGIAYAFPGTQGASSTVLATNGSGSLSWNSPNLLTGGFFLGATSTGATTVGQTNVERTVVSGITLPANTLSTTGGMSLRLFFAPYNDPGANTIGTLRVKFGGTTVCTAQLAAAPTSPSGNGWIDFTIYSNASASAQICIAQAQYVGASSIYTNFNVIDSTGTVNTTSSQAITVTFQWADQTDVNVFTTTSAYAVSYGHQ